MMRGCRWWVLILAAAAMLWANAGETAAETSAVGGNVPDTAPLDDKKHQQSSVAGASASPWLRYLRAVDNGRSADSASAAALENAAAALAAAEKDLTAAVEAEPHSAVAVWSRAQALLDRNMVVEAANLMLGALSGSNFVPESELIYAALHNLLPFLPDLAPAEKIIVSRLAEPELSWVERELLRSLQRKILTAQGRRAEYAEHCRAAGYLRACKVIGPLSNRNREGFAYPDEIENALPRLDFTASVSGRGRKVFWHDQAVPLNGCLRFDTVFYPRTEITAYAALTVTAQTAVSGALALQNGGALKVWVNGELIGRDDIYCVAENYSVQRLLPVTWRAGANEVLLKISGDDRSAPFMSLRVLALPPEKLTAPGSAVKADKAAATLACGHTDEDFAAYHQTLPENPSSPPPSSEVKTAPEENSTRKVAGMNWGGCGYFTARLQAEPQDAAAAAALAVLYRAYGCDSAELERGNPLADVVLAFAPHSPWGNVFVADRQKNENQRRKYLRTAAAIPGMELAQVLLMQMDVGGGFVRKAEKTAQAMLAEKRNLHNAYSALMLINQNRHWDAESFAAAKHLTELTPYFTPGWLNLAQNASGDAAALAVLESARKRNADADILTALADKYRTVNREADAEKIYRELLTITPDDENLWWNLAQCRIAAGDLNGAVQTLKSGLNWSGQSPFLWEQTGRQLLRAGHKAEGLEALRKSLSFKRDNPDLQAYCEMMDSESEKFYRAAAINAEKLPGIAANAADYPDYNTLNLLDQAYIQVNANGTTRMMVHTVSKVLRPAGVRRAATAQVYYDPERQRVDVVEARVTQPDGSIIAAPQIVDFPFGGHGGEAAVYSAGQIKEIRIPQARVGSIIEIKYVREDFAEPLYFDEFADGFFFGGAEPALTFRYTVACPEKMPLHWKTAADEFKPQIRKENGMKIIEWNESNLPGIKPEPAMPPYEEIKASLAVSTFADWNAVGAWADNLFTQQMELPEDIKKFAHELVKDCATREAKIKKIYQFVTDEIRYVSISFGIFGYKPHKAERTFRSRYGDCKDTAVLFVALLREVGIEAYPALVRTRDKGEDPLLLPRPNIFNHAIAYVPAEPQTEKSTAYWLDGTTDYHPFGVIPFMDKGTNALVIKNGGGEIVRIDAPAPADNRKTSKIKITLEKGGAGKIEVRDTLSGDEAAAARAMFSQPKQLERMLKTFVQARFPGAEVSDVKTSAPNDLEHPEAEMTFTITSPRLAAAEGGRFRIPTTLLPRNLSRLSALAKREYALMLGIVREENTEVEIILPENAKLEKLPEDIQLAHPAMEYSRTAEYTAPRVVFRDKLVINNERVLPAQYAEFRDVCGIISVASDERLTYEE